MRPRLTLTPQTLTLTLTLTLTGCGPSDTPDMAIGCMGAYLGDEAAPMELELFALGEDLQPHPLDSCGPIDIVEPPQGGRVIFVGVRAKNLDPCDARLSGALRDATDDSIDGLENRSTIFTPVAGRPGWGETSAGGDTTNGFRYVANIPVCPNMSSTGRGIAQQAGVVEIALTDKRGKKGSIRQRVFPRCAQSDALRRATCECLCAADYRLDKCQNIMSFPDSPDAGACFPPDGGASDGAARD